MMVQLLSFILIALSLCVAFYLGILLGIKDCKRAYGIGKGVTPEAFTARIEDLCELAYGTYDEVDYDGPLCP